MCVSSVSNVNISESIHTHLINANEVEMEMAMYFTMRVYSLMYEMKYSKSCRKKEHTEDTVQSCAVNSTLFSPSLFEMQNHFTC